MPEPPPPHVERLETLEDAITAIKELSHRLETALKHITRYHLARMISHSVALVLEVVGTVFILLDAMRLSDQAAASGMLSAQPAGYQVWYYHQEILGIVLLFSGILAQSCVVFIESLTMDKASKTLFDVSPPVSPK